MNTYTNYSFDSKINTHSKSLPATFTFILIMESSIGETVCGDGHAAPRAQPYISFVVPAPISEQSNKFNVQLDDGRVFTVEPPEGCSVGDTVHAVILDDDETGLSTLMLIPHESSKALPVAAASSDTIQFEEIWHEEEGQPQGRKRHTLGIKTISAMAAGAVIGITVCHAVPIALSPSNGPPRHLGGRTDCWRHSGRSGSDRGDHSHHSDIQRL